MRSLSRGQKSWITKLTQKGSETKKAGPLRGVILKPAEYRVIKNTKGRHSEQAKATQLPVFNKSTVIHTGKGGTARRNKDDSLTIRKGARKHRVFFSNAKNFEAMIAKARKHKLTNKEIWGFSIGDNVNAVQFRDFKQLMHYMQTKDDWHTKDGKLPAHASLVLTTVDRSHVIDSLAVDDEDFDDEEE